ncbi:MAG: hypothetical protein ACLR52_00835 [Veillonella atypica]
MNATPWLATSWKQSDDKLTGLSLSMWVKFSNGNPLTLGCKSILGKNLAK